MKTLENYDQRFGLSELTPEEIIGHVENAQDHMARCTSLGTRTTSADDDRVLIWLSDRLDAVYYALEHPAVPVDSRCAWCFYAGPRTDEAWTALPSMTLDEASIHSQVCEHNPMVQEIRRLTALLEEHGFVRGEAENPLLSAAEEIGGFAKEAIRQRDALSAELEDTRTRAGKLGDELKALYGKVSDLEATNEELRGRALGIDDDLRDAIRALLKTETTAGELRRALGELVR